jgi:hypothetical protein
MAGTALLMGVLPDPDRRGWPIIGIAWPSGTIASRRGPVQCWRLTIGRRSLEGRWICRNREFVRLGDAAEEV